MRANVPTDVYTRGELRSVLEAQRYSVRLMPDGWYKWGYSALIEYMTIIYPLTEKPYRGDGVTVKDLAHSILGAYVTCRAVIYTKELALERIDGHLMRVGLEAAAVALCATFYFDFEALLRSMEGYAPARISSRG